MGDGLASKYTMCYYCGDVRKNTSLAYIAPEDGLERNYFPEIKTMCVKCGWKELKVHLNVMGIVKKRQTDLTWLKENICKIKPNYLHMETVLFLLFTLDTDD